MRGWRSALQLWRNMNLWFYTVVTMRTHENSGASIPLRQWCIYPCFRFPLYHNIFQNLWTNFKFHSSEKILCLGSIHLWRPHGGGGGQRYFVPLAVLYRRSRPHASTWAWPPPPPCGRHKWMAHIKWAEIIGKYSATRPWLSNFAFNF